MFYAQKKLNDANRRAFFFGLYISPLIHQSLIHQHQNTIF
jgi:hypothetical protein